jgi:hypothetical protein
MLIIWGQNMRMRADLSEHMLNLGYFEVWIRPYPSSEQHHAHTWYTCTHELKKFVGVTELQKSCGYTGTTHEPEGLLYVRSMSKAKSVGIRNGKPIVNHVIYRFSSSKANICIHFEECLKNVKFFTDESWTLFATLVGEWVYRVDIGFNLNISHASLQPGFNVFPNSSQLKFTCYPRWYINIYFCDDGGATLLNFLITLGPFIPSWGRSRFAALQWRSMQIYESWSQLTSYPFSSLFRSVIGESQLCFRVTTRKTSLLCFAGYFALDSDEVSSTRVMV